MKSFCVWVFTSGDSNGATNAVRFATEDEAREAGNELMSRWFAVERFEVRETTDPVNYRFNWDTYRPEPIEKGDTQ